MKTGTQKYQIHFLENLPELLADLIFAEILGVPVKNSVITSDFTWLGAEQFSAKR